MKKKEEEAKIKQLQDEQEAAAKALAKSNNAANKKLLKSERKKLRKLVQANGHFTSQLELSDIQGVELLEKICDKCTVPDITKLNEVIGTTEAPVLEAYKRAIAWANGEVETI